MKKSSVILSMSLAITTFTLEPYTVNASNFTKPRAKTLRRIAKNLSLAVAIEAIYLHPRFTAEQQILLKSIPSFISGKFTPKSLIQLRDGSRFTIEHTIQELKKLEATILIIIQDPAQSDKSPFEKVIKSVRQLFENLEKIV